MSGPAIRSLSRRIAGAAALWAVCCLPQRARAESLPTARLEVTLSPAAKHCLSAAALTRSVEARLRRRVFRRDGALLLRVALDRRGANWIAELQLSDSAGPLGARSLGTAATHCSALDDTLALVVALLVDTPPARPVVEPAAESATPKASRASLPTSTPRAATPLVLPADTWAPRAPWEFAGRAGAASLVGVLPGLAAGPLLGVSARWPRGPWLRLEVELALPKQTADGPRGVRLSSQRAGLSLCGLGVEVGTIDWQFCAGQRVGRVTAQGFGFEQSFAANRLYWAAVVGGELSFRLTRSLYLPVALSAEIPLTRDQFVARDVAEPLYRVGPIAGRAAIALELRGGS
jgi:hypothetical protein